jgi:hypothetical protein
MLMHIMMKLGSEAELLEVVLAGRAAGCLASRLHRRQQQGNQDANDGDRDEQLNKRKAAPLVRSQASKHDCTSVPGGMINPSLW